ncbi:hypothetical protein MKX07_005005 [Trichoderma sp. CBMAI-0711]|uniref:Short chain dehydrognease/reductase n=1 Tax=Trichoderma parareesei TaxID=858221 RepID=A0A2H3A203_TRIPA|nr:hypothetical protein MKX07_005005 [Trichoderma sp. CBMAI-0711]OTA06091.1 short chain dehydrognease/reductase [Trichoderma parareesei]
MGLSYNPDTDVPNLAGKVILITGGNGIGKQTVLELAKHSPSHIYFTGRNTLSAANVISQSNLSPQSITFIPCDLASLESVRQAAETHFKHDRLDIFIANAGILAVPPGLTKDGYEIQFGTNHLGNAALLLRLLPVMLRTARDLVPDAEEKDDVRFVAVTSLGYFTHPVNGIDFAGLKTKQENLLLGKWARYGQSKLANVLFTRELGKKFPQITSVAVHPGVVKTEMITRLGLVDRVLTWGMSPLGMLTPREGAYNTLWAATAADVRGKMRKGEEGGEVALFEPVGRPHAGSAKCRSDELAGRLWEWTVEEVGVEVEGNMSVY